MKKDVIIIGAGGHGNVVADIVKLNGDNLVGFLDDKPADKVLGAVSDYEKYKDCYFVIAIGNAEVREQISKNKCRYYTAIHPSAIISPSAEIGEGTVVMPNAVINADAKIGKHCIINTSAVVEHDNEIGDFAHISVGAKLGGTVHIGKSTWVGIGACIKNNTNICENCLIGAGAVVVKDIMIGETYVGVPAERLGK
ncbi:MAG: acetyltransferase [Clostridia bacterium]|nr:acetyltransferase [Clostridia bacterium]